MIMAAETAYALIILYFLFRRMANEAVGISSMSKATSYLKNKSAKEFHSTIYWLWWYIWTFSAFKVCISLNVRIWWIGSPPMMTVIVLVYYGCYSWWLRWSIHVTVSWSHPNPAFSDAVFKKLHGLLSRTQVASGATEKGLGGLVQALGTVHSTSCLSGFSAGIGLSSYPTGSFTFLLTPHHLLHTYHLPLELKMGKGRKQILFLGCLVQIWKRLPFWCIEFWVIWKWKPVPELCHMNQSNLLCFLEFSRAFQNSY